MSDDHKDNHGGGEAHGEGHAKKHGHGGGHGGGGGGGHAEGEHEGAPEWLISFADNVALMMGFFVILLAMNMAKKTSGGVGGAEKYPSDEENPAMQDFALAVRKAFNRPVSIDSTDPAEASLVKRLKERLERGESSDPAPDGRQHNVQAPRTTDFINITGYVTFRDNASDIDGEGLKTLKDIAERVRGHNFLIEVRGHVSAIEAHDDATKAMRLGYDRAFTTAQALAAQGVEWDLIRVVSCGDHERATPRAGNAAEHQNNQRAEVVITQEQRKASPYAQPVLTP